MSKPKPRNKLASKIKLAWQNCFLPCFRFFHANLTFANMLIKCWDHSINLGLAYESFGGLYSKTFYGLYKLQCFTLPFTYTLVLNLQARLGPSRVEPLTRQYSNSRLLDLPANIRLEWKRMVVPKTVACYNTAAIMAVKSNTLKAPGQCLMPIYYTCWSTGQDCSCQMHQAPML